MAEIRRDPITGRWVIIAPERSRRPEDFAPQPVGALDGDMCPFCEGQEAVAGRELLAWRPHGGVGDGPGWRLRVVANREPALRVEGTLGEEGQALLQTWGGLGAHEVVIESAEHRATLATMSVDDVWRILWAWRERLRDLRRDVRLKAFFIVKNVGAAAGATLDHPHSQLLALPLVPPAIAIEVEGAAGFFARRSQCVFCEVISGETTDARRVISSDAGAVAIAPFASRVPFEAWVLPRAHCAAFEEAGDEMLRGVAERLRDVMRRLDATLVAPPYSMMLHTCPVEDGNHAAYHWHLEIVPRLRPESGVAWDGGVAINAVPPEEAAQVLRAHEL
jgi:UDPglucose--hexose-1-phosphate uridylyltransferase